MTRLGACKLNIEYANVLDRPSKPSHSEHGSGLPCLVPIPPGEEIAALVAINTMDFVDFISSPQSDLIQRHRSEGYRLDEDFASITPKIRVSH